MKLVLTYVVLTAGVGLPPDKNMDVAMQTLKDDVLNIVCKGVDRIRLRLVIDTTIRPLAIERFGKDVIIHCFINCDEFRPLRLDEKSQYLRRVAESAVRDFVQQASSVT